MPLIAPDVVRYAFNGRYLERAAVNVLDMVINDQLGPEPRDASIVNVAETLLGNWVDHVMPNLSSSYTLQSVSWVDLNSADGSVGSISQAGSVTLPQAGELSGSPYTGAVALLVTKQTAARRGQRPGRFFLAGLTENYVEGNLVTTALINDMNAGLSTFIEDITETGVIGNENFFPTVVHTRNAGTPQNPNIVYDGNTQVTNFTCEARVSTQKRRNRR